MAVKLHSDLIDVGPIPADWIFRQLGEIGKWYSGGTPSMKNAEYWSGETPWASPKDMKVPRLYDTTDHITAKAISDGTRILPTGAVLIVIRGMILAHSCPVARSECPLAINQDMKALVVSYGIDSNFVLYWLIGHGQKLLGLTTESTHGTKRLPPETLFRVRITLPPTLAEQEAIAGALSDADAWIESLEQLIAKKRQIKQGAMQELLTGKRRLPGFSGEWETKRLGEIVDTDPENLGSDTRPDYAFNYISLEDVDVGTLRSYSEHVFQTAPSRARRRLRPNDVLVSTVRPNLLSHLLFTNEGRNWVCSTGFCVVRCRKGVTHPYFVFSQVFSEGVNRQIEALLTGSNYPAINSRDVRALVIPIPNYDEQTAIATVLSDMDIEIESLESKLAKGREVKQGVMQELLTGRIRLVN